MRRVGDLLTGEPLAITGAITATGNLLFTSGVVEASPELIASLNVAVGAWLGVLRWLVVPNATARADAATAATAGYQQAVVEVSQMAPAEPDRGPLPPYVPPKRPARKR